jgi:hypothetical protein
MWGLSLIFFLLQSSDEVGRLLDEQDFVRALEVGKSVKDPLERSRALTEVYYRAGSPTVALEMARSGLSLSPDDQDMLFKAAAASLWLKQPKLARNYLGMISSEFLDAAGQARAAAYLAQCYQVEARAAELQLASRKAKGLSAGVALLTVFCLAAGLGGPTGGPGVRSRS